MESPMAPDCPRCGQQAGVKQLEATPESAWFTCRTCGYVWRGPGTDAFAFIVCSRGLTVRPVQELRPSGEPRAPRFAVDLPVRYRAAADADWQEAVTENISRSGVLLRAPRQLRPRTAIELVIKVPSPVPGAPPEDVTCLGDVVRTAGANGTHAIAVAVGDYRLRAA
jgi:hypothetical protein